MDETSPNIEADAPPALDPAQQSLSEALRVSFGILKIVMVVLLIAMLLSIRLLALTNTRNSSGLIFL